MWLMRRPRATACLLLFTAACATARGGALEPGGFFVAAATGDGWAQVLRSMGLVESPVAQARVMVVPPEAPGCDWAMRVAAASIDLWQMRRSRPKI